MSVARSSDVVETRIIIIIKKKSMSLSVDYEFVVIAEHIVLKRRLFFFSLWGNDNSPGRR